MTSFPNRSSSKSFTWRSIAPSNTESSEKKWLCMCKHTKNVPYCDGTHKTLEQTTE